MTGESRAPCLIGATAVFGLTTAAVVITRMLFRAFKRVIDVADILMGIALVWIMIPHFELEKSRAKREGAAC
jgi:hypothetical protein